VTSSQPLPIPLGQPVMVLGGRIDPADIPKLCDQARDLLAASATFTLPCDVRGVEADGTTLDTLARIALLCRRLGRRLEIDGASRELEELVLFAGLTEVLPCLPDGPKRDLRSGLQPGRQAEQREEAGGIEEERDPCDPIA
jgi:hypothetical protein